MDLERGIIKAFFYDYPLERFVNIVEGEADEIDFIDYLPQILKWKMPAFDVQEIERVIATFKNEWGKKYTDYKRTSWPLLFVADTAKKLLTLENGRPKVQLDQLLRWRMVSLPVSEDIIALSWLAWEERNNQPVRTNFVWEDTLQLTSADHQNICGSKGLCDLHAHLGASSDAFNIRWIYWMNHCEREPQEIVVWDRLAVVIRYYIFEICCGRGITDSIKANIVEGIKNGMVLQMLYDETHGKIKTVKSNSLKPNIGQVDHWDYAILDSLAIPDKDKKSPYMLHVGERFVIYEFLRRLYLKEVEAVAFADFFYLYILIKVQYRKEKIQTNGLVGLSNYQLYEKANTGVDNLGEARRRYALQTALGENGQNYLETRISWEWDKTDKKGKRNPVPNIHLEKPLFGEIDAKAVEERKKLLSKVRLIVSYSKSDFIKGAKKEKLHELTLTFDEIVERVAKNKACQEQEFSIVGIDFTGSDECVRPEVYSQLVRYARKHKPLAMKQFTYHTGEDFYDLLDGLRTIDEVLRYLKWDKYCRIGHALALATEPYGYYSARGWNVIATKQVLLDNLVWFLEMSGKANFRIAKSMKAEMKVEIKQLYKEIGYSETWNLKKYTQSMKLRSDHPVGSGRDDGLSLYAQTALDDATSLIALRQDRTVKSIFDEYYDDKDIQKNGSELTFWKMPREIVNGVKKIQEYLLGEIATNSIAIETCPTSNYMIGYFERYIDLPLFKFLGSLANNNISINTDDKGIIATSIENEYALIGAAMMKSRKYKGKYQEILRRIRQNAENSKFRIVSL